MEILECFLRVDRGYQVTSKIKKKKEQKRYFPCCVKTKGVEYLGETHTVLVWLQIDCVQDQLGRLLWFARFFDGIGAQNFVSVVVRFMVGAAQQIKIITHVVRHLFMTWLLLL